MTHDRARRSGEEAHEYRVGDEAHRLRLDRYVRQRRPELGRHQVERLIRSGAVRVDQRARDPHYFLKRGQTVTINDTDSDSGSRAQSAPRLLLQTPRLIVAAKPPGMTTNPVDPNESSLLAWVTEAVARAAEEASAGARDGVPATEVPIARARPGIVHRLDRDASGIVLFSHGPRAHRSLRAAFERRSVHRHYWVLVAGKLAGEAGEIDAPLARDAAGRWHAAEQGRPALTRFRRHAVAAGASLLEVRPETGRTHQIRAHFAAIGHPVVGDPLYGPGTYAGPPAPRLWLHASAVEFSRRLAAALDAPRRIECPLWEDLADHATGIGLADRLPPPPPPR